MKQTGIILIIIGILMTLWGAFALMMAFNGFTTDTSYVGRGIPLGYAVSAGRDANGNFIPITAEQEQKAAADYDVLYQANIKSHKTRGALLAGAGIVLIASGVVLKRFGKK